MVNNNKTHITFIIDRSGSMTSLKKEAEGGLRQYIEDRKNDNSEISFTLVQFDTEYEVLYNALPLFALGEIKIEPRGMTALLDAVGRAINETGQFLSSLEEKNRPGKVLFVILTDGEENSSRNFSRNQIKEMIEHQTTKYNWLFVYLGANQDSFTEAGGLGILRGNTINFAATSEGTQNAIRYLSHQTQSYTSTPDPSVANNFFDGAEHADEAK